jgi:SIR2-like protein
MRRPRFANYNVPSNRLPTMSAPDLLRDIARSVAEQQCVLFLGAGIYARPPEDSQYSYADSDRPLIGSELSSRLASKSDFERRRPGDSISDLQRVALDFELAKGRSLLIDEVRDSVQTGKRASSLVRALTKLPFRLIITTNYDTHFEDECIRHSDKTPLVSYYHNNVDARIPTRDYSGKDDPSVKKPLVLKIHGDIANTPESIVITEEDYIQFVLRMADAEPFYPIPRTALYFVRKWPTLFLGYSLRDYNLRILFKTLRWQLRPDVPPQMYSVDRFPDPLILEVLQNHRREVKYVVEDAWRFIPQLLREVNGTDSL